MNDRVTGKTSDLDSDTLAAIAIAKPGPGSTAAEVKLVVEQLEKWRKEGSLCRDTPGATNPYAANTLSYYIHVQGWLARDLQLGLCRANRAYRETQIASGSITKAGIEGDYGFSNQSPLRT